MDSQLAIIERNASFATLRLRRPEGFNLLSPEMIDTLSEIFTNLESQPQLRAIILIGSGENAFAGETGLAEPAELTPVEAPEVSEGRQALYNQIERCRKPVIVAIDGPASGDGCQLALACHLRIASLNSSFSFPSTANGSATGDDELQQLAREIGRDRALEVCQSGGIIRAEEALRIGLINRVAAEGRLLLEAESLASQIATMAPLAIRACLEAVTRGVKLPPPEGFALEAQLFSSLFATNDVHEGTCAFLEKRQPVFKGN